ELYDPATETSMPAGPTQFQHFRNASATALDGPACRVDASADYCGDVLVVGNMRGCPELLALAPPQCPPHDHGSEIYDIQSGRWVATGLTKLHRSFARPVALDGPACRRGPAPAYCGNVLIAGGATGTDQMRTAEIFDPKATDPDTGRRGAYRAISQLTYLIHSEKAGVQLATHPSCSTPQPPGFCDKVLLAAELFDPATETFERTDSFPSAYVRNDGLLVEFTVLDGASCRVPAPPEYCGKVLMTGLRDPYLYDPVGATWSRTGPRLFPVPPEEVRDPSSFQLHNIWYDNATLINGPPCSGTAPPENCGRVVVGVTTRTGHPAPSEIYDPSRDVWLAGAPMSESRLGTSATRLDGAPCRQANAPNYCGAVLVAGGATLPSGSCCHTSTEMFRPWLPAPPGLPEIIVPDVIVPEIKVPDVKIPDLSTDPPPPGPQPLAPEQP
ncbi:MAG: hypothetical protein ACRDIU_01775, partial [Actinomycetota bacterium]